MNLSAFPGQKRVVPLLAATEPIGHIGDSLRILPDRRQKQQTPPQPKKRPRKPGETTQIPPATDQQKHIDDYA